MPRPTRFDKKAMRMKRPLKVQIIVTPGGERMAILPEAELDALLALVDGSPAELIPVPDAFTEALASEMEEIVPSGFLDRLLAGANPIKVWREYRGLSIIDLAEAAEMPAQRIAALEAGDAPAQPAEIQSIAEALKLSVDDLV